MYRLFIVGLLVSSIAFLSPKVQAAAAPTLTSISPVTGNIGDSVTLTGTNFIAGSTVRFNGATSTSVTISNTTTLVATLPTNTFGVVDVTVCEPTNQCATLYGAVTYTDSGHPINKWTGVTSTDWNIAANWSLGHTPTSAEVVVIDGGTNQPTLTLSGPTTLQALSIGRTTASTLTLATNNDSNPLTLNGPSSVGKSGTLTHASNTTTAINKLNISSSDNFTIEATGKINLDLKGYTGNGPGATANAGQGSSYGGYGNNGKSPYGSVRQPNDLGSGDGYYKSYAGGGAARLNIAGTFTNNGSLTTNTTTYYGSGGSVWITTGTLAGTGSIQADSIAGSGGRIAIYANNSTYTGTKTAKPNNSTYLNAAGTVYTNIGNQPNGDLTIEGGGFDVSMHCTLPLDGTSTGTVTYDNLKVTQGAKLCIQSGVTVNAGTLQTGAGYAAGTRGSLQIDAGGTLNATSTTTLTNYQVFNSGTFNIANTTTMSGVMFYQNGTYSDQNPIIDANSTVELQNTITTGSAWNLQSLSIKNGGTLTHKANAATHQYSVNVATSGNLTIDSGGKINADMRGYTSGYPSGTTTSQGASYGGYGAFGKDPYGSIRQPTDLGANSYANNPGGGAIKLSIGGAFTHNGSVTANTNSSYGAAGSVWIATNGAMSGTGVIQADAIAGSGGRVAIYANSLSYTGIRTAKPNNSNYLNAAGTVYTNIGNQPNGDLTIEGGGFDVSAFCTLPTDGINTGVVTYDNLKVTQGAKLCIKPGVTVNVGNLIAATGPAAGSRGNIQLDGTLNVPNNTTIKNYYLLKNGIYSDQNPLLDNSTIELQDVTSSSPWSLTTLTLNNNSTVTTYTPTSTPTNSVAIKTTGDLTINSGSINADNKGWPQKTGPGYSSSTNPAAHAGYGFYNSITNINIYGNVRRPTDYGSGGVNANGGGVVRLDIGGTLTNNGTISANSTSWGSAGSVWVNAKTIAGSNTNAVFGASNTWAYGGAGRVAIYVDTISYTGKKQAYSQGSYGGGAGTIYTKLSTQLHGDLVIDNNGMNPVDTGKTPEITGSPVTYDSVKVTNGGRYVINPATTVNTGSLEAATGTSVSQRGVIELNGTLNVPDNTAIKNYYVYKNGTYSDKNPIIDTGTTFELNDITSTSPWQLTTLTVNNGGSITTYTPTSTPNNTVNIKTTGNITINTGGTITADNKGWPQKTGPGYSSIASSAAHAGYGFYNSVTNTNVYGSVRQPTDFGSGGVNANGGGAIRLDVGGTLTNNGTVSANSTSWGSAGSIWVSADTITGSNTNATFSASNTWAYGGAGRVAYYANTSTYTGKKQAYSQGTYGGGAGTIYSKLASQSNGDLIIDNGGMNPMGTGKTPELSASPVVYDSLTVTNGGRYLINPATTVTTGGLGAATGASVGQRGIIELNGTLNVPDNTTIKNYYIALNGTYSDKNPIIDVGSTMELDNITSTNPWSLSTLTVNNTGTITTYTPTGTPNNPIYITATGDMTFNTGSVVNADMKGWPQKTGPGAGTATSQAGAYAGYAAYSGAVTNTAIYGSIRQPTDFGSGGYANQGGGAIRLNSGGTITNNGSITANSSSWGSAGSIWVTAKTIAGTNTNAVFGASNTWAYASGGRMAFYADTSTYAGKKQAYSQGGYSAGAGTIYNKLSSQPNGDLVIDNNNSDALNGLTPENSASPVTYDNILVTGGGRYFVNPTTEVTVTTAVQPAGGSAVNTRGYFHLAGSLKTQAATTWTNYYLYLNGNYEPAADVTVGSGSNFEVMNTTPAAPWQITPNFTVANGGTIFHTSNASTETYTLNMKVAGTFTVASGGMIDVNGRGYTGGAGPGKGTANYTGGGYGGQGYNKDNGTGGVTYGSAPQPTNIGSGGSATNNGGAGGGAVKIESLKDVVVNGTIRADGTYSGYGGGSGGSIWLLGKSITGAGVVTAKGGAGTYGGGGGRISFNYTNDFIVAAISPSQGTSGDQVTITGTGLSPNAVVKFGKSVATYTYIDSTKLIATAPARNIPGVVDVIVSQPTFTGTVSVASGGTGAENGTTNPSPITQVATIINGFTYISSPPAIMTISPKTGPEAGGTRVKVSGSNFYLPNKPTNNWYDTGKTTGTGYEGPEMAVLGDKIYLLGGSGTSAIYTANTADPTTWTNTGKVLPGGVRYGHLEIIDQTMYYFTNNSGAIYTANTADPTTWTNTGKAMSVGGEGFSIVRVNDRLYRYGGTANTKTIQTATIADPLTWTNAGTGTLAYPVNYSATTKIGDKIWFFGSHNTGGYEGAIYYANISDPTTLIRSAKNLPLSRGIIFEPVIIGETMYLPGGYLSGAQNSIQTASINDPETWVSTGTIMPGSRYGGQIALIQDAAYYFDGYNSGGKIFKMDLARTTDNNAYYTSWHTDWHTTTPDKAYTQVTIGGVAATNVSIADSNTLYATTGPHAAGLVDTTVANTDMKSSTLAQSFRYVVPATITSASPNQGGASGGDTITITGSNFVSSMQVSIGGTPATTEFVDSNTLLVTTPPHPIGMVDIAVAEPDVTPVILPNGFSYVGAPPVISGISPRAGPYTGGTKVTITGTGLFTQFDRALTITNTESTTLSNYPVRLNVDTASLITAKKLRSDCGDLRFKAGDKLTDYPYWIESGCNSATTSVWVKVPSLTVGANTVYMTYGDTSLTSASNGQSVFSFFDDFSTQDPNKWDFTNGNSWTIDEITGTAKTTTSFNYLKSTGVLPLDPLTTSTGYAIGASMKNASTEVPNDVYLKATIGGTTYGIPHITATNSSQYDFMDRICAGSGTCPTTPTTNQVKYEAQIKSNTQKVFLNNSANALDARTVSLSGTIGDVSMAYRGAGSTDYIYIRKLTNTEPTTSLAIIETATAPTVTFDGLAATNVSTNPGTSEIYVYTPAHTVGPVNVVVTEPGHRSVTLNNAFTYVTPPTITSITPAIGPNNGGNTITITGNNFKDTPVVLFGEVPAASVQFIDSYTLIVTTAAHPAGTVDVSIANQPDNVATIATYAYTYLESPPSVSSVAPTRGTTLGNTTVKISGSGFYKNYAQTVTVTNNKAQLSNYPVMLTINTASAITAGRMRSDCGDLRVKDATGALLPYWIEPRSCNTAATYVWTKPSQLATGANSLTVFYGDSTKASQESPQNIFTYFDDFSIQSGLWNWGSANWSIVSGTAKLGYSQHDYLYSKPLSLTTTATDGYAISWTSKNSGLQSGIGSNNFEVDIDDTTYSTPSLATSPLWYGFFNNVCAGSGSCPAYGNLYNWAKTEAAIVSGKQQFFLNNSTTATDTRTVSFTSGEIGKLAIDFWGGGQVDHVYVRPFVADAITTSTAPETVTNPTVLFDGIAATVTTVTPSELTVTTPAHTHQTVDVSVANPNSTAAMLKSAYTYYPKSFVYITASPLNVRETQAVPVTFELRDDAGNPVSYSTDMEIKLSSSTTSAFFARNLNEAESTRWDYNSIILPAGQSQGTFYYKNNVKGSYTIFATAELADGQISTSLDVAVTSRYRLLVTGITDPVASGTPSSVTVQAIDYTGAALHDYVGTIAFTTSDSAAQLPPNTTITSQMMGGKTFINGVTMVTQGEWCVTVADTTDPDIMGQQCNINVTAPAQGTISKLAYITPPPMFAVNEQSDAISVQTQDNTSTPIPVGANTTIYLYSNSDTGEFSTDSGASWYPSGHTATIRGGTTSTLFYYRDRTLGTPILTARDDQGTGADYALQNAVMQATVGGGKPHHFGLSPPQSPIIANFSSQTFRVTVYDSLGNEALLTTDLTVWITTDSTTGLLSTSESFDINSSTRLPITIPAGQTGADFYFKDTKTGAKTVHASDTDPRNGDTGILDASSQVTVNGGQFAKFGFLTAPQQIVAGGMSDLITIELRDALDNRTVSNTDTNIYLTLEKTDGVLLAADGTTPITNLLIKAGQSTASFRLKQTTYIPFQTVVASDNQTGPDGDTGIDDTSQAAAIVSGNGTKLAFTGTPETEGTVGIDIGPYTVGIINENSVPVPAGADTPIFLSSSATAGEFSLDGTTWSHSLSTTLRKDSMNISFYYRDTTAGSITLTAADQSSGSDINLTDATHQLTLRVGNPTKLAYTTNPQALQVGQTSTPITIRLTDDSGNLVITNTPRTITIVTNSPTGKLDALIDGSFSTNAVNMTLQPGQRTISFYYKDFTVGTSTLTANSSGLTDTDQIETITWGDATKLSITGPESSSAGTNSGPYTISAQNTYGITIPAPADIMATVTSNHGTTGKFDLSIDGSYNTGSLPITIPKDSMGVSFYYKDTSAGSVTLTGTAGSMSGTKLLTINPTAATQIALRTVSQTLMRNQPSNPILVELRDQYGNPTKAVNDISLTLTSSSSNSSFTDLNKSAITSTTIKIGENTASFLYIDQVVGSPVLTISSSFNTLTQTQTIVNGAPTGLSVISLDGNTFTAGTPKSLQVSLTNQYGAVVSATTDTEVTMSTGTSTGRFDLSGTGSFTNNSLTVTIPAGSEATTLYYKDTTAGSAMITAARSGFNSGMYLFNIKGAAPYALRIVSPERTTIAGKTSEPITIGLVDVYGNTTLASADISLTLTSAEPTAKLSTTQTIGSTNTITATITAGLGTVDSYIVDTVAGSKTITASQDGLTTTTQQTTITAADFHHIGFSSTTQTVIVKNPSNVFKVVGYDTYNNPRSLSTMKLILSSGSTQGSFSANTNPWSTITSLDVADNTTEATFYYQDARLADTVITVASDKAAAISQDVHIVAGSVTGVAFTSAQQTITTNTPSAPISISLVDANSYPAPASGEKTVQLTATSSTGQYSLNGVDNWNQSLSVTYPSGTSTQNVYYRDSTDGTVIMAASSAGLTTANQTIAVVPGAIAKVFIEAMNTTQANVPIPVTIQTLTSDNRPVANQAASTISLTTNNGGEFSLSDIIWQPISNVTITAGQYQMKLFYRNTKAGTDTLTATPPSTTTWTAGTATVTIGAGGFARYSFVAMPTSSDAGATSGEFVIQAQDAYGNNITVGSTQTIYLYGSPYGKFAASTTGPWGITSIEMLAGSGTTSFYYTDMMPGNPTLAASDKTPFDNPDADIQNASTTLTINSLPPSQFAFISPEQTVTAGQKSEAILIEARQANGNKAIVGEPFTVSLKSSQADGQFYASPTSDTPITSITLPVGGTTATVYYQATKATTHTISAYTDTISPVTQPLTVIAAPASKLAYSSGMQTKTAGVISDQIHIQLQDPYNNPAKLPNATTVNLTSSSSTGQISLNISPWQAVSTVTIPANTSDSYYYYRDTTSGFHTLSASSDGLVSAAQKFRVSAGNATKISIVTPPQTLDAGQPSSYITATLMDQYGNATLALQDIPVYVWSTSAKGVFSEKSDFSSFTTRPTILGGTSSVSFYYKDTQVGSPVITVADLIAPDNPDVGLTNSQQTLTIKSGLPHHLAVDVAPNAIAGQTTPVQVIVQNQYNIPVAVSTNTMLYLDSGSGVFSTNQSMTPTVTSVTLPAGQSNLTLVFRSTAAGSTTIGIRDTLQAAPDDNLTDISRSIAILPDNLVKLHYLTTPQTREAGEISTPLSIQAEDQFGNAVLLPNDMVVYLSSSSPTMKFSSTIDFATTTDKITIIAGTSIGRAYFRDTSAGSPTILASDAPAPDTPDSGLTNDSQTETITTGVVDRLGWGKIPIKLDAGQVSDAIEVQTQNRWGVAIPAPYTVTAYLSHSASGQSFALSPTGPWDVTSVTIPSGQASTPVYYRINSPGNDTLVVSDSQPIANPDTGFKDGSATINTQPGTPTHLVFTNPSQSIIARHPSEPYTVEIRNQYGAPVAMSELTHIYVRSSSATGEFAAQANGPWGQNYVDIPAGSSSITFYYHDSSHGSQTITASDNLPIAPDVNLQNATQPAIITKQTASHLYVTNISTPQIQGSPSSVVVEARDSMGYTVSDYAGTVSFSSSDSDAVLPPTYTFNPAIDKGIHTFGNAVSFLRIGIKSITATDTTGTTGTQSGIVVNANTAGPIAKLRFNVDPPLYLDSGKASQALNIQSVDRDNVPSNAPEGGFTIKLKSDSPTGEYALTPTGPWQSALDALIPGHLNSTNVYYRDFKIGTSTLTAADWQAGYDEASIQNAVLLAQVTGLQVFMTSALEVNNNAHINVPSGMIYPRSDDGLYRARSTYAITVKDQTTGNPTPAKLTMTLYKPDGSVYQSQVLENVTGTTYTIDPIIGASAKGTYRFDVSATATSGNLSGGAFHKFDVSGWSTLINYNPANNQIGDKLAFTVSTKFNGAPADPTNFSVNFRDNNGKDVASSPVKTLGDTTRTGVGEYSGSLETNTLLATDPQFNNAYSVYTKIFDTSTNQILAEDNHNDIFFLNNPALAPKAFAVDKVITSTPPANETFNLKFSWQTSQYATKYNLYRSQNRFAQLYSDPCSIQQIKENHRMGDVGAVEPYCETTILQSIGIDDSMQWVKMGEAAGTATEMIIDWTRVQQDLPDKTYYYVLRAENSRGESGYSTMAITKRHEFTFNEGDMSSINWISLPTVSTLKRPSDIVKDIEGGTGLGSNNVINNIGAWSPTTQSALNYSYRSVFKRWSGVDTEFMPADGITLTLAGLVSPKSWTVVGTDKPLTRTLTLNDDTSNLNWISLPYSNKYTKLSDIVKDIEGSNGAGSNKIIDNIGIWTPGSQVSLNYSYRSVFKRWSGVDSEIQPGDGVVITLSPNSTGTNWSIPLIINPNE